MRVAAMLVHTAYQHMGRLDHSYGPSPLVPCESPPGLTVTTSGPYALHGSHLIAKIHQAAMVCYNPLKAYASVNHPVYSRSAQGHPTRYKQGFLCTHAG